MLFDLQIVLSFADDKGRAAGKVRLITKLSNVAINEYDQSHYDNEPLGMDGVSVNAGALYNDLEYCVCCKTSFDIIYSPHLLCSQVRQAVQ